MVLLEGIVIYILFAYAFVNVVLPIILDIIWIKRVKRGKSKVFGPLGIVCIIATLGCIVNFPRIIIMIGEYFGWID